MLSATAKASSRSGRAFLRLLHRPALTAPRGNFRDFRLSTFDLRLLFVFFFLSLTLPSAGQTVTATVDRNTISVGESATLTLTFQGGNPEAPPSVPSQVNLSVTYLRSSSQLSIINGRSSSSVSFHYSVIPTQPGDYVIPAVQTVVDGRKLSTQPVRLRALKATTGALGGDGIPRRAFLKLIVPKTTVYVGEVFAVDVQLFVTSGEDLQMPQLEAEGFVLGKINQPLQTRTQLNNVIYQVVTFKLWASAAKAGKLTLGPARCTLVVHLPQANRRSRDPFGDPLSDAFDLFGPRVIKQQVTLISEPVAMEALALPAENVPPDFTGAVGEFSLAVSASPTNVMVGDPITLKIQLAGTGGLDSLALPQQDWREFRAYPPTSSIQTTDPLGVSGVKNFEQVIIPQNAAIDSVPPVTFSYFDPVQRGYRTLSHPAIALSVRPSSAGQPQPTVMAGPQAAADAPQTRDIVHIKPHLGMVGAWQRPLLQQGWFVGLQSVPLLIWLVVALWRKRQEMLARDPRLRRRLQVNQFVAAQLKELRRLAAGNETEQFFVTVFRLLQEQIGERLNLPASAITEAVLDEQLRRPDVSEELVVNLHGLFQACNQARYAPVRTAHELMAFVPAVEQAIAELRELRHEK